jgi:hypothetical protein
MNTQPQPQPLGRPGAAVGFGIAGAALGLLLCFSSGFDISALLLPPICACIVCLLASIGARASAGRVALNLLLCGAVAASLAVTGAVAVVMLILFSQPWEMG